MQLLIPCCFSGSAVFSKQIEGSGIQTYTSNSWASWGQWGRNILLGISFHRLFSVLFSKCRHFNFVSVTLGRNYTHVYTKAQKLEHYRQTSADQEPKEWSAEGMQTKSSLRETEPYILVVVLAYWQDRLFSKQLIHPKFDKITLKQCKTKTGSQLYNWF